MHFYWDLPDDENLKRRNQRGQIRSLFLWIICTAEYSRRGGFTVSNSQQHLCGFTEEDRRKNRFAERDKQLCEVRRWKQPSGAVWPGAAVHCAQKSCCVYFFVESFEPSPLHTVSLLKQRLAKVKLCAKETNTQASLQNKGVQNNCYITDLIIHACMELNCDFLCIICSTCWCRLIIVCIDSLTSHHWGCS